MLIRFSWAKSMEICAGGWSFRQHVHFSLRQSWNFSSLSLNVYRPQNVIVFVSKRIIWDSLASKNRFIVFITILNVFASDFESLFFAEQRIVFISCNPSQQVIGTFHFGGLDVQKICFVLHYSTYLSIYKLSFWGRFMFFENIFHDNFFFTVISDLDPQTLF